MELQNAAIIYLVMDHFTVVTDHKPLKGVFAKELPDVAMSDFADTVRNLQVTISTFHGVKAKQIKLLMLFLEHLCFLQAKQTQIILLMFAMQSQLSKPNLIQFWHQ